MRSRRSALASGFLGISLVAITLAKEPSTIHPVPNDVNLGKLETVLRANGFNVDSVGTQDGRKFIIWGPKGETKDPTAIIESLLPDSVRRMRALAKKWKKGPISSAEKEELIKAIVLKSLEIDVP